MQKNLSPKPVNKPAANQPLVKPTPVQGKAKSGKKRFVVPRPDRESIVKHRREVLRQIYLPIILFGLLIFAVMILSAYATFAQDGDVARWAAISTIWLVIPQMVGALTFLALLLACIYGLYRLLQATPRYTGVAQDYVLWFSAEVKLWTDKLIKPVIALKSWLDMLAPKEETKETP